MVCFTSSEFRKSFSDDILYINDIDIGKAVRASCSYPLMFSPCEYNDIKLIDGGIRENVPWKELKSLGAEKVISIVFEEIVDNDCEKNLIEVANRSINLLCRELSNYEMQEADYILKIKDKKIGLLDMSHIDRLYKLGYEETQRDIDKILQLCFAHGMQWFIYPICVLRKYVVVVARWIWNR